MKKGFTLIELLGVIILIAILMSIAFPSIINFIKSSNEKSDELNEKLIYNATEIYVDNNKDKFPKVDKNSYCITLKELVEIGSLKSPINLYGSDVTDTKSVKVTYQSGYKYEIVNTDSCIENNQIICSSATISTKTTGNIPTGEFSIGDEYICEVNDTSSYHFFVLSTEGNNVNLIMDHSVNNTGGLSTGVSDSATPYLSTSDGSDATSGPITAFNFISASTSSWTNIPNINMNYTYSNSAVGGFSTSSSGTVSIINTSGVTTATYDNLKARLPYESEVTNAGCTTSSGSCPSWLIGNIYGAGYWTIPTSTSSVNMISSSSLYPASGVGGITNKVVVTVRPVITIEKDRIN